MWSRKSDLTLKAEQRHSAVITATIECDNQICIN